jgi:hypothetical protein
LSMHKSAPRESRMQGSQTIDVRSCGTPTSRRTCAQAGRSHRGLQTLHRMRCSAAAESVAREERGAERSPHPGTAAQWQFHKQQNPRRHYRVSEQAPGCIALYTRVIVDAAHTCLRRAPGKHRMVPINATAGAARSAHLGHNVEVRRIARHHLYAWSRGPRLRLCRCGGHGLGRQSRRRERFSRVLGRPGLSARRARRCRLHGWSATITCLGIRVAERFASLV